MNKEIVNNHSSSPPTTKNIILIGFMGCGKSTLGGELHRSLGYPFFDTDEEIEKQEGTKISQIFKEHGEDYFRQLETQYLKTLIEQEPHHSIISTGGGIITRPENIPLLRKLGFVVWLSCTPKDIYDRTSRNNNRPLLQCENPNELIIKMLGERSPQYKDCAHLKINSSSLDINEITCGILESARYHFSSKKSQN